MARDLALTFVLAVVYRYGPSRETAQWRWITWGSTIAALLWIAVSGLFSWYAASFGKFNETYGSLGAIIGFMTWLWLSAIIVLLGAEIDTEMEHHGRRLLLQEEQPWQKVSGPRLPPGAEAGGGRYCFLQRDVRGRARQPVD